MNARQIFVFLVLVVGVSWCAITVGEVTRRHAVLTVALWLALPLAALALRYLAKPLTLDARSTRYPAAALAGLAAVLSFTLFANYDSLRDQFGSHFVPGYWSSSYADMDDFGGAMLAHSYGTSSALWSFLLWAGEWVFIALGVLIPLATWTVASKSLSTIGASRS